MARDLTSVVPVMPGHEDALRSVLRAFPDGAASPLARVAGTHFARWVVAPLRDRDGGPLGAGGTCLLFAAEFDHESATAYLDDLLARSPDEVHSVFEHCTGYPGAPDARWAAWLLQHRVVPGFSEDAIPGVLVSEVLDGLALRKRVRAFALRARTMPPAELKAAWDKEMALR